MKNENPLATIEATKPLSRVLSEIIDLVVDALILSKEEASGIVKSKKGNKKYQDAILHDSKFFSEKF